MEQIADTVSMQTRSFADVKRMEEIISHISTFGEGIKGTFGLSVAQQCFVLGLFDVWKLGIEPPTV